MKLIHGDETYTLLYKNKINIVKKLFKDNYLFINDTIKFLKDININKDYDINNLLFYLKHNTIKQDCNSYENEILIIIYI